MENLNKIKNLKLSLDAYTKIVLSVIAVCLVLVVTNIYFKPASVQALQTVQDVNIKSINGSSLWGSELPVNLKQVDGRSMSSSKIPIDLQTINGRSLWGDQLPVDIKAINGNTIFGSEIPVKVR